MFQLKDCSFKTTVPILLAFFVFLILTSAESQDISLSDVLKSEQKSNQHQSEMVPGVPDVTEGENNQAVDVDLQKLASEVSEKVKSASTKKTPAEAAKVEENDKTKERREEPKEKREEPREKRKSNTQQADLKMDRLDDSRTFYLQKDESEDVDEIIDRVKRFQSVYVVTSRELTPIRISLRDVSRIVCPGKVEGKVFSGEKPIEVKEFHDSLYVKNLPVKKDGEYVYDRGPKDLMVICEGKQVFSLLLIPDDVPSVTVYLQSSTSLQIQKAMEFETENSYIESVLKLVKHVYNNEVPPGYEIEDVNRIFKEYNEAILIHRLNWLGGIFTAEEYILQAKKDVRTDEMFWIKEMGNPENMVAITVVDHELKAGYETRIIVIRKRER